MKRLKKLLYSLLDLTKVKEPQERRIEDIVQGEKAVPDEPEDDNLAEIADPVTIVCSLDEILPETISGDNRHLFHRADNRCTQRAVIAAGELGTTESTKSAESAESESDSDPLVYRPDIQEALEELEFGRDIFQYVDARLLTCTLCTYIFCWPNCYHLF